MARDVDAMRSFVAEGSEQMQQGLEHVQDRQEQSGGRHDVVGLPVVNQRRGFPQDERAHDQDHGRVDREEQRRHAEEDVQDGGAEDDQHTDHHETAEETEILARRQRIAGQAEEDRARAARPARPPHRDHRTRRPEDDHQRVELRRERLHGRPRGLQLAHLGQRGPGADQPA